MNAKGQISSRKLSRIEQIKRDSTDKVVSQGNIIFRLLSEVAHLKFLSLVGVHMKTRKLNPYYYKRGELVALRCSECGKLFHTPAPLAKAAPPPEIVMTAFEAHGCSNSEL